ncbi:putative metal-dependent hydrolase of the TIM-barrel fold protein [Ruegeria denitrificans]|uniref:Putative metal-dependent hydrolase of the TIM-barrel fold protein n=1 Tax=Ruegeria denitrificans TaxID=1715692 RepID=A0A0P1IF35_9RHOB|nr:amidohydrolase family protein [Ruegeria denitrificans]CUJ95800.1 putative metal-dependent hydrolase of the TIM-barrel fold protein [Ruegeria denitrificans]
MKIDAHHHLWDLSAVTYPWLMEKGITRFFGDPASIQRDYLLPEFRADAEAVGVGASVHIQVGAADPWAEAQWVQSVAEQFPDWPLVQVAFCDLTARDLDEHLDRLQTLPSVRGVRQIIGRAPGEDASTGTNALLKDPAFLAGLQQLGNRGLSFDLQLLPELMEQAADILAQALETQIALCHAGSPHDRTPQGLQSWADNLTALSSLPQVNCKLSGLGMFDHNWSADSVAPIISTCLSQFGADRCMFGSNFPVDSLTSTYGEVVSRYQDLIPSSNQDGVFHGTSKRFYRI